MVSGKVVAVNPLPLLALAPLLAPIAAQALSGVAGHVGEALGGKAAKMISGEPTQAAPERAAPARMSAFEKAVQIDMLEARRL